MPNKKLSPQQIAALNPGQLTAYSMGTAMGAMPQHGMNFPANYPISPDLEIRGANWTPPAPSLLDRLRSGLQTFEQKAQLAGQALMGRDPYAQQPVDPNFYRAGQDASTLSPAALRVKAPQVPQIP